MNEKHIMKDMSHCIKNECALCSRFDERADDCRVNLMRDANCIMKMQNDALKGFPEELEKLKSENARLRTMAKFSFDEKTLVDSVNDIIRYTYFADMEFDDGECGYMQMLYALLRFGQMLPSKYKVLLIGAKDAPKLVKQ